MGVSRDLRYYFVLSKDMKRIRVIFAFDHLNVSRNLGSTSFFFLLSGGLQGINWSTVSYCVKVYSAFGSHLFFIEGIQGIGVVFCAA